MVRLPVGAKPVAAVVGLKDNAARGVAVVGADAPGRPVLCLQPMTAADARYAEGRRAGLLEAAEHVEAMARPHEDARIGSVRGVLRDLYRVVADEVRALAVKDGDP